MPDEIREAREPRGGSLGVDATSLGGEVGKERDFGDSDEHAASGEGATGAREESSGGGLTGLPMRERPRAWR
jgi:hypothetical protein